MFAAPRSGTSEHDGVLKLFGSKVDPIDPRLPKGMRVYAIGDVHGRADLLDRTFTRIDADLTRRPVAHAVEVFLGDYVDRGPSSRTVLDLLIHRSHSRDTVFLKGNHEAIMVDFLHNPAVLRDWRQCGGLETLLSYGLKPTMTRTSNEQKALSGALVRAMPLRHQTFLHSLRSSYTCGDFFFVHAGVKPGVPLAEQRDEDLLWIRDDFLLYEQEFEKIIVHGHTPVPEADLRPNRINIDTGAYATGKLTCVMIEGNNIAVI
jgi:serine/threonine protein phosphatase 1